MLKLPTITGLIRRRLLVNYRVDPSALEKILPSPFRPKLHGDHAIAGICLIRLESIRPRGWPVWAGIASENAAHRIAVRWTDAHGREQEGVFVPRRDTGSLPNHLAGGRIFPGEHHLADFDVHDHEGRIKLSIQSRDGSMQIRLAANESPGFPSSSCFRSLEESSAFFEPGRVGFSVTRDSHRLDGIRLEAHQWQVRNLAIESLESSFFEHSAGFPPGSVLFDHALIMRDISHDWHQVPAMTLPPGT
ncbi:MAG: hypothetical protein EAZ65_05445 [Verrucomicrobia bacterium]|nr:MAG: hypothetical protein EAZ84_00990 [Verrucomicrobiota bacterium]TAE87875.1 MAG: hypothetical protein EAZ82_06580 [Verrucomicrobiota bacterium]TAF25618.1 MAG: hypothetical protein EAZ71_07505 [Verrucomicrobiota bacterium]TAF41316.1 MAG: hypothetical protein EAZ65_05445 [Verrucomicrobiota bacterium]